MSLNGKAKQPVNHFGVFYDSEEGYSWLLQQGTTLSAIGLPTKHCPFRIKTALMMCPHNFSFGSAINNDPIINEYESRLKDSRILQSFDPIYLTTDKSTIYIQSDNIKHFNSLMKLQQVLNPSIQLGMPASMIKDNEQIVVKRLNSSNLVSYIIYGLQPTHLKTIDSLAKSALVTTGKLVFIGEAIPLYNVKDLINILPSEPATFDFINKVTEKKLKEIGSYRLKKLMRSGCHFN